MDIRQLEYFAAVIENGSFAAAAHACFVSRQALTKAVRNIEHEVGEPLVYGENNRILPTTRGMELFQESEPLLRSFHQIEKRFSRVVQEKTEQTVSVALGHGARLSLPDGCLMRYQKEHPTVRISFEETTTDAALELLDMEEVDFALVGSTPEYLQKYEHKLVISTGLYVYVPVHYDASSQDVLTLSDVDKVPFATFGKRNHLHRYFMTACVRAGVMPDFVIQTSDAELLRKLAHVSDAWYFGFPSPAVHVEDSPNRVLRRLDIETPCRFGTYAITHASNRLKPVAYELWSALDCLVN